MAEPTRSETQLGLAHLTKRFATAGVTIIDQQRPWPQRRTTYFVVGNSNHHTTIVVSDEFLDDLSNTREYQAVVDAYALALAGRIKCGSPEVFFCLSGIEIRVEIKWPIQSAVVNSVFSTWVLVEVTNQANGWIAKCAVKPESSFNRTVFDDVRSVINRIRRAVDKKEINFFMPEVHQETYQQLERNSQEHVGPRPPQPVVEQFLARKAYVLGFLTPEGTTEIWAIDPWDAEYLGVTKKELSLAVRVLRVNGLVELDASLEYARPTDKLLARESTATNSKSSFEPQQVPSLGNLLKKETLISDIRNMLEQPNVSALLVIDLDHFKQVNDTKGHLEGDACLDLVVVTIGTVVGRRGKLYRWGGDEFAVLLPDFSTEEAQATAERIRSAVELAKPGGDVGVTTSIGVCGSDRAETKSVEEFLNFADKAMYKSKEEGRNRVTSWPNEINSMLPVASAQKQSKQAIKAQLAQFLKEGKTIQEGIQYSNPDSLRQKQDWEQRVEEYFEKNLDESYAVRFQTPSHQMTTYPAGISLKMTGPWGNTGAKMAMLHDFISELRD